MADTLCRGRIEPVMSEPIKTLPLVFDEPKGRRKPPRHLADLTPSERKDLAVGLGLPGFRAKQLSTHYFSRLVDDPAAMTDLPAILQTVLCVRPSRQV